MSIRITDADSAKWKQIAEQSIRFEVMCVLQRRGVASDIADKLSDFMEDKLGIDCAIVVLDANTNKEIETKIQ